jgi:hypothetical protein
LRSLWGRDPLAGRIAGRTSAPAFGGLDVLGASVDLGGLDAEGLGDLDDAGEAGVALAVLNEEGVVLVDDGRIQASPCARRLDMLALICD